MKIITKREAHNAVLDSLFHGPQTLAKLPKERYDMGKYQKTILGKEVEVKPDVLLLWAEPRRDNDGPYWAVFCLSRS